MRLKTLKLKKGNSSIPTEILYENFTHLEIYGGALESIPVRLFELPQLEVLRIKNTGLGHLPELSSVGGKLHTLILSQNQLKEIPSWLGAVSALKVLDLSHNKIETLPKILPHSLERLILDSNQLSELPPSLFELTKLMHLSLDENPLSEQTRQQVFERFGIWTGV